MRLKYKKEVMPMYYSYSKAKLSDDVFNDDFFKIINKIINKKIKLEFNAHKFRWKDYTVLNDEVVQKPGFDMIIDFTDNWDENYGGLIVYVDGKGNYNRINAGGNSITIVNRKKGINKFIQYLNHYSKERLLVIGTN